MKLTDMIEQRVLDEVADENGWTLLLHLGWEYEGRGHINAPTRRLALNLLPQARFLDEDMEKLS